MLFCLSFSLAIPLQQWTIRYKCFNATLQSLKKLYNGLWEAMVSSNSGYHWELDLWKWELQERAVKYIILRGGYSSVGTLDSTKKSHVFLTKWIFYSDRVSHTKARESQGRDMVTSIHVFLMNFYTKKLNQSMKLLSRV